MHQRQGLRTSWRRGMSHQTWNDSEVFTQPVGKTGWTWQSLTEMKENYPSDCFPSRHVKLNAKHWTWCQFCKVSASCKSSSKKQKKIEKERTIKPLQYFPSFMISCVKGSRILQGRCKHKRILLHPGERTSIAMHYTAQSVRFLSLATVPGWDEVVGRVSDVWVCASLSRGRDTRGFSCLSQRRLPCQISSTSTVERRIVLGGWIPRRLCRVAVNVGCPESCADKCCGQLLVSRCKTSIIEQTPSE